MTRSARGAACCAATVLLAGCGPSDEEVARAVLLASPVPLAAALLASWLLARAWRPLDARVEFDRRPGLVALAILLPLAGLALVGVPVEQPTSPYGSATSGVPGVLEWTPHALWAMGTSYLTLVLVTWRVWLRVRPRSASTWAFLPPLVLVLAPVPQVVAPSPWTLLQPSQVIELAVQLWVYPGWGGLVTGPLLAALIVEVVVRRRRALRPPAPPPSSLPAEVSPGTIEELGLP